MSPEIFSVIALVGMLIFIFLGMWIGGAMILVGFLGYAYLGELGNALMILGRNPFSTVGDYSMSVLPLFIFMGSILAQTGISRDLYNTAYKWFGSLRGGMAYSTVLACGAFAAICGSSTATAATMSKVAIPEMEAYNYDRQLSAGVVAAAGTMGILIPPSMGFILYGLLTEVSIGKLFMAGIIPGILEAVFYMAAIFIMCRLNPQMGPPGPRTKFKEKIASLKFTWPVITLFLLVLGGIYAGIFTPTEAGALGASGALVISLVSGKLTWKGFITAVRDAVETTAMIMLLMVGAYILMHFFAIGQLPNGLSELIATLNLNKWLFLALMTLIYVALGCALDIFSVIILTVPVIFPAVTGLGLNPVWFGVIMVRVIEVGLVTQPVGLNVFVISGATGYEVGTIFRGIVPFLIADIFHIGLLAAVPALSLFIPSLL
jgi:C4-dicarboxylate transporter DctM subunit